MMLNLYFILSCENSFGVKSLASKQVRIDGKSHCARGIFFLSSWKTVQPQVRLNLSIFNRLRPVFVNLNSQLFFVPCPTSSKSKTVFSKEILGKSLSAAEADCCMPIIYKTAILNKANIGSD